MYRARAGSTGGREHAVAATLHARPNLTNSRDICPGEKDPGSVNVPTWFWS
ncbi:MAG: hypothetical protein ACREK8_06320 [Gemmatimonadales bacterium]